MNARITRDSAGRASIKDVGLEARKIDPAAFAADVSRNAPNRQKWLDRQAAALAKARAKLESYPVDKTGV